MVNGRKWLSHSVATAFVLASISCTILTLQALCKKANAEAGIANIQFNLTAAFPNIHLVQKRDFIQSLRTEAKSVANGIVTAVPSVISQLQSAADTLATALPGEVEALIPRNCSIGTKKFCVGLAHNVTCHSLPLNMSKLIPAGFEKVLRINLNDIQPLNDALAKVTMANIQDALIVGVVLAFIVTTISMCSISGKFLCLTDILLRFRILRVGISLLFGMICCIPFLVAAIVLYMFNSKAKHLPPWIQIEEGGVSRLSVGGLCCAIVMLILSTVISIIF
ncbi:hypothetical protein B0J11DRAFT_447699 [Dendryphion nanum]|uniref:Uncharacterized protein n=1 Tax=Dendryphion nanum TaxID=256645 RepID=A0A9P9I953_9PLEO|nr:hypothetical protein B0J11DRAFT_447699 [Dendryphion nanum]